MDDLSGSRARAGWFFRIQSELVNSIESLDDIGPAVAFLGSARIAEQTPLYEAARDTARRMAAQGLAVITGGGPGIMEAANRGCQEVGGRSIGLNIELPREQRPNPYQHQRLRFRYFFIRKLVFVRHATACVVFPGGFGTADELFEFLTLIQTGKIRRFPLFLYGCGYWQGFLDWLHSSMLGEGCINAEDLDLLQLVDTPEQAATLVGEFIERNPPVCPTYP
ncbi:MAG: TIGR00730 family Rossman fold protein [Desulfobulbus propionicus]|nr:MAG: TIGR00730 family Rossman fold protein [Desulfobulbus propionicus]